MADKNQDRTSGTRADDERVGRGVREGMDAGSSRNAHTSGSPGGSKGGGAASGGSGGYGASSGFSGGTEASGEDELTDQMETGATEARTRPNDVGRQAESGMETDPEGGNSGRGRTG